MKRVFTLAAVTGAFAISVSTALAGPLMLGPAVMPVTLKATAVPVVSVGVSPVQTKLLNAYRQVRAFWVSRAIVR